MLVISSVRAARAPPMNTLLDPVNTSNGGASDPHVNAMPISPARAAGMPPMNTVTAPLPRSTPRLGSGTGGAGGISDGG